MDSRKDLLKKYSDYVIGGSSAMLLFGIIYQIILLGLIDKVNFFSRYQVINDTVYASVLVLPFILSYFLGKEIKSFWWKIFLIFLSFIGLVYFSLLIYIQVAFYMFCISFAFLGLLLGLIYNNFLEKKKLVILLVGLVFSSVLISIYAYSNPYSGENISFNNELFSGKYDILYMNDKFVFFSEVDEKLSLETKNTYILPLTESNLESLYIKDLDLNYSFIDYNLEIRKILNWKQKKNIDSDYGTGSM